MIDKKDLDLLHSIDTPAYVVDERLLEKNLQVLKDVQDRSGAKILLALKGFAMFSQFPLISKYLQGVTASGINEALLGRKHMNKEVHIYSPAYKEGEIEVIAKNCDHVVFNSSKQIKLYQETFIEHNPNLEFGIRVNPEYSEVATEIYNPCAPFSRLGSKLSSIDMTDFDRLDGIHFHTMCEQGADTLERTISVVEDKFGKYLYQMKWLNFGGGHHITRADYDVDKLVKIIRRIRSTYDLEVYLEPGEAVALNTGYMVASVLDVVDNGMNVAIIDTSAACHMPDVIEMPYRPEIVNIPEGENLPHTYRLGGATCLAGDIIGDYSFEQPLSMGDKLIFGDMAHYTMVKNNTFNGINLPSIAVINDDGIQVIKRFGFKDFEERLS